MTQWWNNHINETKHLRYGLETSPHMTHNPQWTCKINILTPNVTKSDQFWGFSSKGHQFLNHILPPDNFITNPVDGGLNAPYWWSLSIFVVCGCVVVQWWPQMWSKVINFGTKYIDFYIFRCLDPLNSSNTPQNLHPISHGYVNGFNNIYLTFHISSYFQLRTLVIRKKRITNNIFVYRYPK